MKKLIFTLVTVVLLTGSVFAEYTQTCKVKYKRNYDWSDYYTVDVHFYSGRELNNATKSFNYDSFSTYAIVFWSNDQATVMKLSSFMGCGSAITQSCISNKPWNLEGEDQEGRNWEICTKSYCY